MSFHSMRSKKERERARQPHPVWRGIGLIMIVLIPILSCAISDKLIQDFKTNVEGFYLPDMLKISVDIPLYGMVNNFGAVLALTLLVSLGLFGIFAIINAMVYRAYRDQNLRVFESQPQRYKREKKLKKSKYK